MRKRKSNACVSFSERLCIARGEETQVEVAKAVGISQPTYNQYERGRAEPTLSTLIKLAEHFGVSIDYLLGRQTIIDAANAHEKFVKEARAFIQEAKLLEQHFDRIR